MILKNEDPRLPNYVGRILKEARRIFAHDVVLTQSGEPYLAQKAIDVFRGVSATDIRVVNGRVFFYCGDPAEKEFGTWAECDLKYVRSAIMKMDGRAITKRGKGEPKKVTLPARKQRAIMDCFLHHDEILCDGYFDLATPGVVFNDCVVSADLETHQIVKSGHSADHRLRAKLALDYAGQDALPEAFLGILNDIFAPDEDREEKIELIREFIGACLLGIQTRYDRAVIFLGNGANGKSVLIDIISSLFPPNTVSTISPQDLKDQYYVAQLDGRKLNTTTEMPSSTIVASDKFKAITSGDMVTGRHPHREPISFRPQAGHLFACNSFPQVEDTTDGFWRRMLVVKFNRSFEGSTVSRPELMARVAPEKARIASWAISGALKLLDRGGYAPLPSSEAQKSSWRGRKDFYPDWLNERPIDKIEISDLATPEWIRANCTSLQKLHNDINQFSKRKSGDLIAINELSTRLEKSGYRKVRCDNIIYYGASIGISIPIDMSKS